jgi:penicillin-binding protein 1C
MTPYQAAAASARTISDRRIAMPFLAPHLSQTIAGTMPNGGVVKTTLKLDLQRALEGLLAEDAKRNADGADMALVAIDNRTHRVLAYVGSVDFFSKAGQNDLARAKRSPGSTLKPFAYGLAFDDGFIHPETLIDDEPMRFGDYAPRNFDHDFQGTVTIRQALQQSLNLPAVAIVQRLGAERFSASLQNAGITLAFPRDSSGGSLSVILGGVGISLYDLTALYSGLANGGQMALPVYLADAKPQAGGQLMNDTSAWYVTDILRGSAPPPGFASQSVVQGTRKIAFKTGTSYGFRDAWSVGYSPSYTIGVWVGHADGTPRPGQLARIAALPTLLKAFDLMPPEDLPDRRMPVNVVTANNNGQLPPRLRSFTLTPVEAAVSGYGPRAANKPRILYPPDGVTIDLRGRPEKGRDLVLKAEGGTLPLRWVVNEKPLPLVGPLKRNVFWTPDGDGFVRIAVIDAEGRSAAVQVRLQSN